LTRHTTNKREASSLVPRNTKMVICFSMIGSRDYIAGSYGARARTLVTHWCDNAVRAETEARPEDAYTPAMRSPPHSIASSRLLPRGSPRSGMLCRANVLQALVMFNRLRRSHGPRAFLGYHSSPRETGRAWHTSCCAAAYGTGQPVGLTREQRWGTRGRPCVPRLGPIHGGPRPCGFLA